MLHCLPFVNSWVEGGLGRGVLVVTISCLVIMMVDSLVEYFFCFLAKEKDTWKFGLLDSFLV